MEDKQPISIKVNGKDRPIADTYAPKNEPAKNKDKKEFTWVLPEQDPPPKTMGMQNRRKEPPHELHKKKKMKLSGSSPNLPLHRKKKKTHKNSRPKSAGKGMIRKQWVPAFSAVLVGVIMGMIVLTMFTDSKAQETEPTEDVTQETEPASSDSTPKTLDLNLSIVQGAVFSSKEQAQDTVKSLQNDGYPVALNQENDKTHLFIGAATEKSQAKELGDLYKQEGQDVYVKAFQVHANPDQLKKRTRTFLEDSNTLLETITRGSVHGLTSKDDALTDKQWKEFDKTYQQWKKESGSKQLPSDAQSLSAEVEKAVGHFKNYRKKGGGAKLWQTQQHILKAALQYKNFVES